MKSLCGRMFTGDEKTRFMMRSENPGRVDERRWGFCHTSVTFNVKKYQGSIQDESFLGMKRNVISIDNFCSTTMNDGSGAGPRNIIICSISEQNTGGTRSRGVSGRRRSSLKSRR
jgi:hypothetical protein